MDGHPVAYSRRVITELMVPSYANFGGKVHGGTLMSLMDKLAYVCASKHAGNYCVTVSVDNVHIVYRHRHTVITRVLAGTYIGELIHQRHQRATVNLAAKVRITGDHELSDNSA